MKPTKLGLLSLFARKKFSGAAQDTSFKEEEALARNPTLPKGREELEQTEEMEVDKAAEDGCESITDTNQSKHPSTTQLSPQAADNPPLPAVTESVATPQVAASPAAVSTTASMHAVPTQQSPTPPTERRHLLSVSPGTALSDQKRNKMLQKLLESPQPGLANKQAVASFSSPDGPAAVPITQLVTTTSLAEPDRRHLPCVSPGTALSDKKRKAVLQKLLESPQPMSTVRPQAVLDVDRDKVERIVSPLPAAGGGHELGMADDSQENEAVNDQFGGFNFWEEPSGPGFSIGFGGDLAGTGFGFGGEDKQGFEFGDDGGEKEGDFSFFGVGEESQGGGEDFSFNFGGSFDGEKSGEGEGTGGLSLF
eukprot:GFUD01031659.1.p1 GENE.GFUD01031659.1~~GFUD01031659.1.p1  ORF type:complete len:365 (+),score=179.63 GFUD01031659.1:1262-2356(+)